MVFIHSNFLMGEDNINKIRVLCDQYYKGNVHVPMKSYNREI